MADNLGSEDLESKTDEPQTIDSSYRIITYQAPLLPKEFKNLIIAPFLNSLRYGNDLFKLIDQESYYSAYSRYVEILLQREKTLVNMAALSDGTIAGWCLFEGLTVHYVWVKKEIRRQGICKSILPKNFEFISHITNKGINIWVSKFPTVRFNPF